MDYHNAFQISASGMALEKLRFDVSAANLANMHTSAAPGTALYRPQRVVSQAMALDFSHQYRQAGGARAQAVDAGDAGGRLEYDPQHPHANSAGFVAYPAVNHTAEMVNINDALRAYEANVVAMNAARTMAARALTIGDQ